MAQRQVMEAWVGIFVVMGLAAFGVLALKVGNLSSADVADAYQIEARFDNIGGLKVRSRVTLSGVRIGRVKEIYVDPSDYRAVVILDIAGRYTNLPADSTAVIQTAGILGEQYVALDPGGDESFLKDGDKIMLTQSALVLEDLIGKFLYNKSDSGDGK
ncbi:MAG: outer membrane lipid asymmetry maintenance protein MlaD [Gammaproteobacteria bacterium]|nr:outer membrane lipid asymmetry maintenance protein MlaD [Gammaproteobacteria bacterium]